MELDYRLTEDTLEVSGMDLTNYRHKNSVFMGSFYAKELYENNGNMVIDLEDGDKSLIEYRDSIHGMHVGWKKPLVELVASFMKVAYTVSRGVIYQPFEDPENFIYNERKHRLQIVGRLDTTLGYIDEDFLDWVLECIGFIISEEDSSEFGYLTHQEYFANMDKDRKELYRGYLEQKDFHSLVKYTLETSVIEALDQYREISRPPIDNHPLVRDVLAKSVDEKEAHLEEQAQLEKEQQEETAEEETEEELVVTEKKSREKFKRKKREKRYNNTQKVLQQDKIDEYRNQLGIPEDKNEYDKTRKGVNLLPNLLSILFLIFAIWLAYTFFMWLL